MKKIYRGFTLVEFLVVIGVFVTVSTIIVSVLFTSLRASKKSDTVLVLKQNGENALSQMTKSIRFAKRLDSPAACVTPVTQSSITITSLLDNAQTTFSCTGTSITSNSASLVNTNAVSVGSCSFTCSQPTSNDPPTITIQFILSARNPAAFVETRGTIPFQTSVTMRNFGL